MLVSQGLSGINRTTPDSSPTRPHDTLEEKRRFMTLQAQKLLDWIIPVLLGAVVYSLAEIRKELGILNASLAVAASRVEDHDRRLSNLETLFLKQVP